MATINAKLQTIMNAFATQAGGASSVAYQNLVATITSSDILLSRFNAAATAGTFTRFTLENSTNSYMYSNSSVITVSSQMLADGFSLGRFTFQISHEITHCETASSRISQESSWSSGTKTFISGASGAPDVTSRLGTYLNLFIQDEARANIFGYNGLMDAKIIANGGQALTATQRIELTAVLTGGTSFAAQFIDSVTGALKAGYTFDAKGYVVLDANSIASSTTYFNNLTPSNRGTPYERYSHYYAAYGLQKMASFAAGKTLALDYNSLLLNINQNVPGQSLDIEQINDILVRDHLRPQGSPAFTSLTLVDPAGTYKSEFTANSLGSVTVKTTTGIGSTVVHSATKDYLSTTYNGAQKEILAQTVVFEKNTITTETTRVKTVYNTTDLALNTAVTSQTKSSTNASGIITTLTDANGDGVFESTVIGNDVNRDGIEDVLILSGTTGADTITGLDLNETLYGLAGNDRLYGNAGDDTLDGGAGTDTMYGGTGNDVYFVDSTADSIVENLNEGVDAVNSSATYTLASNVENLTLTGAAAINGTGNALNNVIVGNAANNALNGGAGADTLIGGLGDDTYTVDSTLDVVTENLNEGIDSVNSSVTYTLNNTNLENLTLTGTSAINGTGNGFNNVITGNTANNVLSGGVGNDTLNGGAGADTLVGGTGDDAYYVDNSLDVITENAAEGVDSVNSSATYVLSNNVEKLTLTGTAAINGTGNALANVITGNAANNVLDGGLGADTLIGGAGNDTYVIDAQDFVVELAGAGTDTINSSFTYSLINNIENLTLTGTAVIDAVGNELNNVLTGNSANNVLNGGVGADTMVGGAGNDTYMVDNASDVITETASAGTDSVYSSVGYTLSANVENLTLTGTAAINGAGNALSNNITGNSANNSLDGGAGADTLMGGLGNDVYVIDNAADVVVENLGEGMDSINSSVSYALSGNVENITLTGTAAVNATGNALNNVITGNSGNNIIDGGVGADTMSGGAGNDTYVVDNTADSISEAVNAGTDTVNSSITYVLGSNLENLTLTGTGAVNATGNDLNNIITGNSANNVLKAGLGADTLVGGAGSDTYLFARNDGADKIIDTDSTSGNNDVLTFTAGVDNSQLWFTKSSSDLVISVIGTTDSVTIKDWFVDNTHQVEHIVASNGKALVNTQVDALVNAMSAFAPPASGELTLSQTYQTALNGVIAANWQ